MPIPTAASPQPHIRRPAMRYHGGKFRLAPKLIEIFPPHRVYTEAFGGGASVLLLKSRSYAEIYNDLDGEVVNVFRVLQNRSKAKRLRELLQATPFARAEFEISYKHARSDIERARRTIIRSFMGFGSDSISRMKASRAGFNTRISSTMATGFRWNSNRSGTTPASDWRNYPDHLPLFTDRLQGVVIERRPAIELLQKLDREDALHYVDPPYPHSARREGNGTTPEHRYRWEMTDADHESLARVLHSLRGMVIVSSYPGEMYDRLFAGWRRMWWTSGQFVGTNNNHGKNTSGSSGQKRTECVWLNEAAWRNSAPKLFN